MSGQLTIPYLTIVMILGAMHAVAAPDTNTRVLGYGNPPPTPQEVSVQCAGSCASRSLANGLFNHQFIIVIIMLDLRDCSLSGLAPF